MNLWHTFHSIFDTDDGSLPEIDIAHISPAGLAAMWMYLRAAAAGYAGDGWFWHHDTERETPLDSVPNAAALVVTGEAEIFHTVLHGISFFGAVIPELGVFVFQDSISLDYRMGHGWNAASLTALFELLRQLQRIDPDAHISLSQTWFHPKWRVQFSAAFAAYIQQAENCSPVP
jgi:hypothetical protein